MNSEEFVVHLAAAISRYVRASPVPAELQELRHLAELLVRIARDGQERPTSPVALFGVAPSSDVAPVPLALDVPGVAKALSVGERTARRLVDDGDLPSVMVRGRRLVRRADLETYLISLGGVA